MISLFTLVFKSSSLQVFTVDSVEVRAAPRLGDAVRRIKIVHVSNRSGRHQCPDCGRHVKRGLFEEYEPIRFRDASIGAGGKHPRGNVYNPDVEYSVAVTEVT